VIGAAGQDGSYLSELLLGRGYDVVGVVRSKPEQYVENLETVRDRMTLIRADLLDTATLAEAMREYQPREIYNFAGVTFGPDAWSDPARTAELGTVALARLLEAVRSQVPAARFFQASSAWVFGRPEDAPQNERTRYQPLEPYGAAKAYGDFLVRGMRTRYGLFACSGILYNHESPRRAERFVTRKITSAAARIRAGSQHHLVLGDIEAQRDWSHARDVVEGIWLMMQQEEPADFVLASGILHSVREFVEAAFARVGLDWQDHVRYDDSLQRSNADVVNLVGDATAARTVLGWRPRVGFDELVASMVDADMAAVGGR
jgi:GDPmannose 4,6-dehydratase